MYNNTEKNRHILANSLFELFSAQTTTTGTLFIFTEESGCAQIVIEESKIIGFAFDNKNGSDAVISFMKANFIKSKFIKDYQLPLTNAANVSCSHTVLKLLGLNDFLISKHPDYQNNYSSNI